MYFKEKPDESRWNSLISTKSRESQSLRLLWLSLLGCLGWSWDEYSQAEVERSAMIPVSWSLTIQIAVKNSILCPMLVRLLLFGRMLLINQNLILWVCSFHFWKSFNKSCTANKSRMIPRLSLISYPCQSISRVNLVLSIRSSCCSDCLGILDFLASLKCLTI
jgi:hypothetical protein